MATDTNSISKIVSGISIAVVAGMILWLCSSTYNAAVRLSVLETQFNTIQGVLTELKVESKLHGNLLVEIRGDQTIGKC